MIENIDLRFIRCYEHVTVALDPGINLFFGSNGVGKTTLLEAAHVCSSLQSFKTSTLREMINSQTAAAKIKLETREQAFAVEIHQRSKKLSINGQKPKTQQDFIGKLSTVIIAPEHHQIIDGSKQTRQQMIDNMICQTTPTYLDLLKKHNKVLVQKKALLKQELPFEVYLDQALIWHEQNRGTSQAIRAQRQTFLLENRDLIAQTYRDIGQQDSCLDVSYVQNNDHAPHDKPLLTQEYHAKRVLYGAQRDDIAIQLDGKNCQKYASQGEKATTLLVLKLMEYAVLTKQGQKPVFLLDDIGTTLDQKRRQALFAKLDQIKGQTLISTCDPLIKQEIASTFANTSIFLLEPAQHRWRKTTNERLCD